MIPDIFNIFRNKRQIYVISFQLAQSVSAISQGAGSFFLLSKAWLQAATSSFQVGRRIRELHSSKQGDLKTIKLAEPIQALVTNNLHPTFRGRDENQPHASQLRLQDF